MGNVWNIKGRYKEKMNVGSRGDRGITAGGQTPSNSDVIDYVNISSTGDAVDFGNLTVARRRGGSGASNTRVMFGGGYAPGVNDTVDYINPSSLGNAADFGNLAAATGACGGFSNQTRFVEFDLLLK